MNAWIDEQLLRARLEEVSKQINWDTADSPTIEHKAVKNVFASLGRDDDIDVILSKLGASDGGRCVVGNGFADDLLAEVQRSNAGIMQFDAKARKQKAKTLMEKCGVHPQFLSDHHWACIWDKHFERHGEGEISFDSAVVKSYSDHLTLRVLQWNILAEGLVPEGFLSPLVCSDHYNCLYKNLSEVAEEKVIDAAAIWQKGCRNVVWQEQSDGSGRYVEFASMAHEVCTKMKAEPPDKKENIGHLLKFKYDSKSAHTGEQLTKNELAVTAANHRLERVLWFVELMQPDIVVLEELDNFEYLRVELKKSGYESGPGGDVQYVRLVDRKVKTAGNNAGDEYLERLRQSPFAFAPKLNSNAKKFLDKRQNPRKAKLGEPGNDIWSSDDDGAAIFWRSDRFRMIGAPEFCLLPGKGDIKELLAKKTAKVPLATSDQACVRVRLEFIDSLSPHCGHQLFVMGTHLTSGAEASKEQRRMLELQHVWQTSSIPEIWCMDANTEFDEEEVENTGTNAIQSFMHERKLESVWQDFYTSLSVEYENENVPVSVWKMRGCASAQPAKIGEDQYQLIDHIFYSGRQLFTQGRQALRLRERKTPLIEKRDWLALIPNEVVPSDHLPIVWDFRLNEHPRFPACVLQEGAKAIIHALLRFRDDVSNKDTIELTLDRLLQGFESTNKSWLDGIEQLIVSLQRSFSDSDGEASLPLALLDVSGAMIYLSAAEQMAKSSQAGDLTQYREMSLRSLQHAMSALSYYLMKVKDLKDPPVIVCRLCAQAAEYNLREPTDMEVRPNTAEGIIGIMDNGGKLAKQQDLDLLINQTKIMASSKQESHIVTALLALACVNWQAGRWTGVQVRTVMELILKILANACNDKAVTLVRYDSLDGETESIIPKFVHLVLKRISSSPNIDTGGALQHLLDEADRMKTKGHSSNAVRFRDAMVISFGKVLPDKLIVKVQHKSLQSSSKDFTGVSVVDVLVESLEPVDPASKVTELRSIGYILKTIAKLSKRSNKSPLLGPQLFIAPMLFKKGAEHLAIILRMAAELEDTTVDKWRTQARAADVLSSLLLERFEGDPLMQKFQNRFKDEVVKAELATLFCELPSESIMRMSSHTANLEKHIGMLRKSLEKLEPHLTGRRKYGVNGKANGDSASPGKPRLTRGMSSVKENDFGRATSEIITQPLELPRVLSTE